ncbi:reverse transcriptase domain-containing protein [Tanacetum coccineum]
MIVDVAETFDNLQRINMKLNPKNCSFGVEEGKFLGYMVTSEGIRDNPTKTKDIVEMQSPKTWGQMQSLAGKLEALNRFLSRRRRDSFPRVKKYNPQPTIPHNTATIGNLIHLPGSITGGVITDQPVRKILSKEEASGKLAQYFIELGAYNITYEPPSIVKGQVLADFINEVPVGSDALVPRRTPYTVDRQTDNKEEWVLYMDGASSIKGSSAGLVLISPTKTEYTYALRLNFDSNNNQAEYEALLAGLRIAKKMKVQSLSAKVDSKLVASQINGNYEACNGSMIKYLTKAREYIECFKNFKIRNIPRNLNQKADVLSKLASVTFNHLTKEILVEVLDSPSTDECEINAIVEEEGDN